MARGRAASRLFTLGLSQPPGGANSSMRPLTGRQAGGPRFGDGRGLCKGCDRGGVFLTIVDNSLVVFDNSQAWS